jgi:hypothetical protein
MDYPVKSVTILMLASFAGGLYVAMSDTTATPKVTVNDTTAATACAELQRTCRVGNFPGCVGNGLTPNAE